MSLPTTLEERTLLLEGLAIKLYQNMWITANFSLKNA